MGKPSAPLPSQYRDEPYDYNAPSVSSALPLSDIQYHDDELPAYDDAPYIPPHNPVSGLEASRAYLLPNELSSCHLSTDETTRSTLYPYNLNALIREEMKYPPQYYIRVHGTHTETHRTNDNKTEKRNITDFDIKVNMTHLLICNVPAHQQNPSLCYIATAENPQPCRYVQCLTNGERGYRGGIFPSRFPSPSSSDPEHSPPIDEIQAWVQAYSSSHHQIKMFRFSKVVSHHNTEYLRSTIRELVNRSGYRGHLNITFPVTHSTVALYSDSLINRWRFNPWICWLFYLTFMWILSWPIIFFLERKYAPIVIHYPYKYLNFDPTKPSQGGTAPRAAELQTRSLVQSEQAFMAHWQKSISRAIMGRHVGWIDGLYKADTDAGVGQTVLRSGNEYVDGFIGGAWTIADGLHGIVGWGADS